MPTPKSAVGEFCEPEDQQGRSCLLGVSAASKSPRCVCCFLPTFAARDGIHRAVAPTGWRCADPSVHLLGRAVSHPRSQPRAAG